MTCSSVDDGDKAADDDDDDASRALFTAALMTSQCSESVIATVIKLAGMSEERKISSDLFLPGSFSDSSFMGILIQEMLLGQCIVAVSILIVGAAVGASTDLGPRHWWAMEVGEMEFPLELKLEVVSSAVSSSAVELVIIPQSS